MIKNFIKFFFLIFLQLTSLFGKTADFSLGLGNLTNFVRRIQKDSHGKLNSYEFNPFISTGFKFKFDHKWAIIPQLGMTFPKNGRDKKIRKFQYFAICDAGLQYESFVFRVGLGMFISKISSNGGNQTLLNGNSSTDFPMPNHSSLAHNLITNLGLEYFFHQSFSSHIQLMTFNLDDSTDRAISYTIGINYYLKNIIQRGSW
jgi:hypothetical protein